MRQTRATLSTADELPEVLAWLRTVASEAGVPALARGRLILAVADLCRGAQTASSSLDFTARVAAGLPGAPIQLIVHAAAPAGVPLAPLSEQALPATRTGADEAVWLIDTGAGPDREPSCQLEQELRAAIDHGRRSADELARLEGELAETNRGVVALYVELEERDEQLRTAHRAIFRSLEDALRPPPPQLAGLQFGVYYSAAQADAPTGGDLYDWIRLPNGDLQVTVVDVVGHGVASTRDALNVTHALRTLALQDHPLPSLIHHAAGVLQPAFPDLMATVLVARLTVETGVLQVAGGGHPPLLLAQAGAPPTYLQSPGRGIGYPAAGSQTVAQAQLRPGATALIYTDGLVEATRNIVEGMDALVESTTRHLDAPPQQLAEAIAADLHREVRHTDDTLLLAVRWTDRPGSGG